MLLKDGNDQAKKDQFEKQIYREVPSQLPLILLRKSLIEGTLHGDTVVTKGKQTVFCCKKSGAPMKVKMVFMNVFNDDNTLNCPNVPVGAIYCPSCDKVPAIAKGMPVYARDLSTATL